MVSVVLLMTGMMGAKFCKTGPDMTMTMTMTMVPSNSFWQQSPGIQMAGFWRGRANIHCGEQSQNSGGLW